MKTLVEREAKKLGDSLPMQTREFEVLEMVPVKREKKVRTPEEIAAREAAKKARGGTPDPDDDDDDLEGRDEERFDISISSEFPVERWFGKEILDHSPDAVDL